mmetsp:Transcript_20235/g.29796  ORF Transcript_20235/g.29796 Transcript_20235/m.29796 type:complete len:533 (+) Transcript_20235:103-1701(+)
MPNTDENDAPPTYNLSHNLAVHDVTNSDVLLCTEASSSYVANDDNEQRKDDRNKNSQGHVSSADSLVDCTNLKELHNELDKSTSANGPKLDHGNMVEPNNLHGGGVANKHPEAQKKLGSGNEQSRFSAYDLENDDDQILVGEVKNDVRNMMTAETHHGKNILPNDPKDCDRDAWAESETIQETQNTELESDLESEKSSGTPQMRKKYFYSVKGKNPRKPGHISDANLRVLKLPPVKGCKANNCTLACKRVASDPAYQQRVREMYCAVIRNAPSRGHDAGNLFLSRMIRPSIPNNINKVHSRKKVEGATARCAWCVTKEETAFGPPHVWKERKCPDYEAAKEWCAVGFLASRNRYFIPWIDKKNMVGSEIEVHVPILRELFSLGSSRLASLVQRSKNILSTDGRFKNGGHNKLDGGRKKQKLGKSDNSQSRRQKRKTTTEQSENNVMIREATGHNEGQVLTNKEWKEIENRMKSEINDLRHAIAEKVSALAEKDAALAEKDNEIAKRDVALADRDATIVDMHLELSRLKGSNK